MKHKTATLEGALLDAAVAKAEGLPAHPGPGRFMVAAPINTRWAHEFAFSTDWRDGGPIIERERIEIGFMGDEHGWQAALNPDAQADYVLVWVDGPTPLIAAMRAYVASKFGEVMELP